MTEDTDIRRDAAKLAVEQTHETDSQFEDSFSDADLHLKVIQENNRHKETMIGRFGKFFGEGRSAPTYIAFVAMMLGLLIVVIFQLIPAYFSVSNAESFADRSKEAFNFSASALAFIFGRGIGDENGKNK